MNTQVEFTINLDKSIYLNDNYQSADNFLINSLFKHLVSDYNFIKNMMEKENEVIKKEYDSYLKTLESLKSDSLKTVSFKILNVIGNVETVKVLFQFDYFENKNTALEAVEIEFNNAIRSNNFLSLDLKRLETLNNKKALDYLMSIYKHLADSLEEAKNTIVVSEFI